MGERQGRAGRRSGPGRQRASWGWAARAGRGSQARAHGGRWIGFGGLGAMEAGWSRRKAFSARSQGRVWAWMRDRRIERLKRAFMGLSAAIGSCRGLRLPQRPRSSGYGETQSPVMAALGAGCVHSPRRKLTHWRKGRKRRESGRRHLGIFEPNAENIRGGIARGGFTSYTSSAAVEKLPDERPKQEVGSTMPGAQSD